MRLLRPLVAVIAVGILGVTVLAPSEGEARPGGGSSFSGGSRSGSSSSGSSRSGSSSSSSSSSSGSFRSGSSTSSSSSSSGAFRSTSSSSSTSSTSSSTSSSSSGGYAATRSDPARLVRTTSGKDRADKSRWTEGGSAFDAASTARPEAWPATNEVGEGWIGLVLFLFVAVPVGVVGTIVWSIVKGFRRGLGSGWSTKAAGPPPPPPLQPIRRRSELEVIRQTDPLFSIALFEDFLYALYTEVRTSTGAGHVERVAPYLDPSVRAELTKTSGAGVAQIVVGAMRFLSLDASNPVSFTVEVEFETNYTETKGGKAQAYWVSERWHLRRARTARSRAPDRARVLDCPGCGAPIDRVVGGQCRHCRRVVDNGAFDWIVVRAEVDQKEPRGPMLEGTTEEQGTDSPTIKDPWLSGRLQEIQTRDRAFDVAALERRVGLVFQTMQVAWSTLAWEKARPFLSDNLWQAQRYWIEAYKSSGLRNMSENARIQRIELARVTSDAFFDAITVRVFATGLDYTIRDADGAVVGGSRTKERAYSEYWTLLRGSRAQGPTHVAAECPRCGAPFEAAMAVQCRACGAKVNSGEFDWVLARIEQDESYSG